MSVLDVCPTSMVNSTKPKKRYRYHYDSSTTSSYDTISTTSSRNSSFEALFSRLLDALIFTSAIAITAYSYLTGTLIDKPAALIVENNPLVAYTPTKKNLVLDPMEDAKRRRTQQWAEDQVQLPTAQLKKRSYSSGKVQPLVNNMKREKKRTQSLPPPKKVEIDSDKDEKLSRMEEQIQSLLKEGQNALLNPIAL